MGFTTRVRVCIKTADSFLHISVGHCCSDTLPMARFVNRTNCFKVNVVRCFYSLLRVYGCGATELFAFHLRLLVRSEHELAFSP